MVLEYYKVGAIQLSIHKVLAFIFGLWLLQGILSYIQISNYKKTLSSLRDKGRVYIGHQKGKLTPGSIIFVVLDDNDFIVDFREMKGISVFDKFRKKDMYIGKSVKDLIEEININKRKNVTNKAILSALKDFL